jgi:hypothetical protein
MSRKESPGRATGAFPTSPGNPDHNRQPLTDRWITAGRDAALHILDRGHIPLLEAEVLQALRQRGGLDCALAEMLHAATGGEIR